MTPISQLQEDVGQKLADALPEYTNGRVGWSIVTEVKGDVGNKIKLALSKIGIGIAVFTPTWTRGDMENRRDVQIVVSIAETQIINMGATGMKFPGIDLCWIVQAVLDGFKPGPWSELQFIDCKNVDSGLKGADSWDLTFQTSGIVAVAEEEYEERPIEQEPLSK